VNRIGFLFGLTVSILLAQLDPYQAFMAYMIEPGGKIMEIEFSQEQYGERYESSGTFFYFGKKRYTFDAVDQRISYNNGIITTINKSQKQVIHDQAVPGEVTIFDVLTGEGKSIQTGEPIIEKGMFRIPFTLLEWEMKGVIRVVPVTGEPREVILSSGEVDEIRIRISSSEPANGKSVTEIDLDTFEIIDLRE
jgi:hypothetical protein